MLDVRVANENVKDVPTAELAAKLPQVLEFLRVNSSNVVVARPSPGAEPDVVMITPMLLANLGQAYDGYRRLVENPQYGELTGEVVRLRRAVGVLLRELKKFLGPDAGDEAWRPCLEALFGKEQVAGVVTLNGGGWEELSDEENTGA